MTDFNQTKYKKLEEEKKCIHFKEIPPPTNV